jgi:predicted phosphoadenosine phosphosulfate sulfurtransferase
MIADGEGPVSSREHLGCTQFSFFVSLIPTWKRLCVTILKNDHVGKYMGFSQTKRETEKRKAALDKYKDL